MRPLLILQARCRKRTPRGDLLGLQALVFRERWNPAIDFAVHFVTFDETGIFQRIQNGGEVDEIVWQYIQLQCARPPLEASFAVGHREQPNECQPQWKPALLLGVEQVFVFEQLWLNGTYPAHCSASRS